MNSKKTKELVVISGKGGTGKTSVTAALASFFPHKVLVDGDVDAADLHLLLKINSTKKHDFYGGHEAEINPELCNGCGLCESLCRFDAIVFLGEKCVVQEMSCEGCKVCVDACPEKAISWNPALNGVWMESETKEGSLVHARLIPGSENSGKLVTLVREKAREKAIEQQMPLILLDGPPGIGCPVIAAVTGADALLMVTEPTPSGLHDLERVLQLAAHFKIPSFILLNKADINLEYKKKIEEKALEYQALFIGDLPYSKVFTEAQLKGMSVIEAFPDSEETKALTKAAKKLKTLLSLENP